ncbi:hypothetical protein [Chitinimonas koreensis]|uniref:hypothetical protein n=1 Tax=Chitinimonas koreensis TaxID=356302 RepID=UPI00223FDD28|nr:hypothetical protein [Chitinimonas koreensis]
MERHPHAEPHRRPRPPVLPWRLPHWRRVEPVITIRQRSLVGAGVVLLVHLLLFIPLTRPNLNNGQPLPRRNEVEVNLSPLTLLDLPSKQEKAEKPRPRPAPQPRQPANPRAIHPAEPVPHPQRSITVKPAEPTPAPVAKPPASDLAAYMEAERERRAAVDRQLGLAPEPPPPAAVTAESRTAKIMRNLQQDGASGVFQIVSKGARTAQFTFRGWTGGFSNSRRELIEVEVAPGGDIDLAIVQRMIQLIRRYYSGDFNWDSHRLGRVVVLSARLEDNAGLEAFLMREFFGADGGRNGN